MVHLYNGILHSQWKHWVEYTDDTLAYEKMLQANTETFTSSVIEREEEARRQSDSIVSKLLTVAVSSCDIFGNLSIFATFSTFELCTICFYNHQNVFWFWKNIYVTLSFQLYSGLLTGSCPQVQMSCWGSWGSESQGNRKVSVHKRVKPFNEEGTPKGFVNFTKKNQVCVCVCGERLKKDNTHTYTRKHTHTYIHTHCMYYMAHGAFEYLPDRGLNSGPWQRKPEP